MLFQWKDSVQKPEHEADASEKTGPARFWELVKDELATVLIANVLFIAACVPIVTIPPAWLSLHMVMGKIVRGKSVSCTRDYFTAFRENWNRAYGAFFLTALPMAVAGYGAAFYLRQAQELPVLLLPFALCATAFWVAMLASTYLYGLLCRGRPLRDVVKPALLLGVAKPLRAVLAAQCYYSLPVLSMLFFPFSGLYLFLIGFSLPCLLGNFYIRTVLKQYRGDLR